MGNPLLVQLDQPADALDQLGAVKSGQAGPLSGAVQSHHVVVGSKHSDLVVMSSVGLHPFKQFLRVMQNLKSSYYKSINILNI